MTPEKKVENDIKRFLEKKSAWYLKVHGSALQPAGTPDILCCYKGRFIAIEVKRPNGGKVSALQKLKMKQIEQSGGIAFVANDVEVVKDVFQKLS